MAIALAGLVLGGSLAMTQPPALAVPEQVERFQLWNDCQPMALLLEIAPDLREGILFAGARDAAESRLRSAHLYTDSSLTSGMIPVDLSYLVIAIATFDESGNQPFNVTLRYYKPVTDKATGNYSQAATWLNGVIGLGDNDFILAQLARNLDTFLANYLRVNDTACTAALSVQQPHLPSTKATGR